MLNAFNRKDKKGFTLIEMVIAVMFVAVIATIGFYLSTVTWQSYITTSDKIDAQSQFRLIMDILDNQVGNSQEIYLKADIPASSSDIVTPVGGSGTYVSVFPMINSDGLWVLAKQAVGETSPSPIGTSPYPIKDLTIAFSKLTGYSDIISVTMTANDGSDLFTGTIYAPNASISYENVAADNLSVLFKMPESYSDLI